MQTRCKFLFGLLLILVLAVPSGDAQGTRNWWDEQYSEKPLDPGLAKRLPLISVRGNRFVDPQGAPILFRGVAASDPDKLSDQGHWNREYFQKIKEFGATLVRIPVHPVAWRKRSSAGYVKLLDQAVEWCTDLGLYIDVDWHSIGNLEEGLFESPMHETSKPETFNFWRTAARHFAGNNTVAFFEIFNEPALSSGKFGVASWEDWKRTNEDIISIIRAFDAQVIPLVAGFDWAYDLTPLRLSPVAAEGIGYVTHPYPLKRSKPWEPKWDEDFGFAAQRYPVLATEVGFVDPRNPANNPFAGYGPAIVHYLEQHNIGWIAWVFDPNWGPSLIKSWDFTLTPEGEFFKLAAHGQVRQ